MLLIPQFKKTLPTTSLDSGWLVSWNQDTDLIFKNVIPVMTADERYSIRWKCLVE